MAARLSCWAVFPLICTFLALIYIAPARGGASTILIRGKKTGEVVPFTAPGKRPTLFSNDNTVGTGVITLNNNTHVAGLNIRGGGTGGAIFNNHGVFALDNFDNIVIEQNSFTDIGCDAVRFGSNNSNVLITRNEITNNAAFGVRFNDDNSNIWVTHNTIRNINRGGIEFESDSRNVIVSYNTIKNVGRDGVIFETGGSSNVRVTDNKITNVARIGVNFDNNNTDVVVAGNTISIVDDGIQFNADNNDNVVIAGNVIKNTTTDALRFFGENDNLKIVDNTFTGIGQSVFEILGINNTLAAGSVDNVTTDPPGGLLCNDGGTGDFTGTIEIDGINFTNGC